MDRPIKAAIGIATLILALGLLAFASGWIGVPQTRLIGRSVPEPSGARLAFSAVLVRDVPFLGRWIVSCRIGVERGGKTIQQIDPGRDYCQEAAKDLGGANEIAWASDGVRVEFTAGAHKLSIETAAR